MDAHQQKPPGVKDLLRVRIEEIGPEGKVLQKELPIAWVEEMIEEPSPGTAGAGEPTFRGVMPLAVRLEVRRQGRDLWLEGNLHTELESQCSRCLSQMRAPIATGFEMVLYPRGGAHSSIPEGDFPYAGEEEDEGIGYYEGPVVSMDELVREQFLLALPMCPVCDEGCRGLCPSCGANLNHESCDCENRIVDPRLAPLKDIKLTKS